MRVTFDIDQLLSAGQITKHDDHKWGYEVWFYNGDQCLKIMVVDKPAKSSLMYHPEKVETFVMLEGRLFFEHEGTKKILVPGDVVTIYPGETHRFQWWAGEKAVFLEVSSHHDDEDVVKLEPSELL